MEQNNRKFHYSQDSLIALCKKITPHIEELFSVLKIEMYTNGSSFSGRCPIHGGDNPGGLSVYLHNDGCYLWTCFTHHCEDVFNRSLIGLVRGILSHRRYKWTNKNDMYVSLNDSIQFLLQFVNEHYSTLKNHSVLPDNNKFISNMKDIYNRHTTTVSSSISREMVRKSLQIPATYYIERGYGKEVLDKYDVGFCNDNSKPMANRVVVPIYDNDHRLMIGCTGRSIFKKCPKCNLYHSEMKQCPTSSMKKYFIKWKHNKGFSSGQHLYNYWSAKQHIREQKLAVIVESPGNIWKLEEAGIHNGVALFGSHLSNQQKIILDTSGAYGLFVIMDNDPAGVKATQQIINKCESIYNIYSYNTPNNDIGEMTVKEIQKNIIPLIRKACIYD